MKTFLLVEVFQGDENSPDIHTFFVGPFDPEPEPATQLALVTQRRYTPVERFKSALNLSIERLNSKYLPSHLEKDGRRLKYEVEEIASSDSAAGYPSATAVRTITEEVERWMKGRISLAA
jgi:hypothetical protein